MSIYVKVIGPGRRERFVKPKEARALLREGAVEAGQMEGHPCIVMPRAGQRWAARSGKAVIARGDCSTRIYAPGQRMGNLYELVASAGDER